GLLAAGSNKVPDWLRAGVAVRLVISYQREPTRPPRGSAVPVASTCRLCAVHKLPLCMRAANNLSSKASSEVEVPSAGTPPTGPAVAGTVRLMLPEMDGTPPGFEIRRITSSPWTALSTPMKYPCNADGSSLSTPCGVKGPGPE